MAFSGMHTIIADPVELDDKCFRDGVDAIDNYDATWWGRVDPDNINMMSYTMCVLGQAFPPSQEELDKVIAQGYSAVGAYDRTAASKWSSLIVELDLDDANTSWAFTKYADRWAELVRERQANAGK